MIFCSKPQKFTWRNAITLLLLLTAGSILILLLIPSGSWFGSETDWYSQHVTIADYMRKILCNRKPVSGLHRTWRRNQFLSLSYYGFMRPDVLISYLFPHVEMEWFIQGYAIFEILLGGGYFFITGCTGRVFRILPALHAAFFILAQTAFSRRTDRSCL